VELPRVTILTNDAAGRPLTNNISEQSASRSTIVAVVAATTFAQVATVMGNAVFPVIAPRLAEDMGVEPSLVGYQMSLIFGTAVIFSPVLSFMVSRWGACRTMQIALGSCVAGLALGLTSSLAALVLTSVLLGMALSVMTPATVHLLYRFSPPQNRNFIFSLKQTGVPLGWALMALFAPAITLAFGWQWALLAVLVVAAVIMFALQLVRARWDDDRSEHTAVRQRLFDGLSLLWRYPVLRWLSASSLFLSFVQFSLGAFAVLMLYAEAGYSLVAAGFMLSLVQVAGVTGRIIWGWVADRSGDSLGLLVKISVVTVMCCVLTAFVSEGWPVALTGMLFIAFGASAVGWNGLFLAEIAHRSPKGTVSVATGGAMVWNFGGALLGPATFATAYKFTGSYAATFGGLTLVAACGMACLLLANRAARREDQKG
jgi:predicted MFS family arabinose efflux permease